ncbi:hypothetical protein ALP37_102141 [Pseudomonas amygdali pv. sesami]|nr:hypothetical protein ALO93_102248 [Pseudomonas amygdali pv. sesami]RMT98647.1 hypothetical protein ALP37_102141 [Pseudomonas amygdali pv. sesami]
MNNDMAFANPEILHDRNCNIPYLFGDFFTSFDNISIIIDYR